MSTPPTPVLYCHPDSGYSYKVALALSLLGIGFEQRHIAIWKPREARSEEFRAVAAHGEVPVLLIDGHALCQSNAILDYLARRERRLDGHDEAARLRVREWLSWEANRISLNLAHSRFGRRWGGYHTEVLAWYDRRSQADLDRLEQRFAQSPFLAGAGADHRRRGVLRLPVLPARGLGQRRRHRPRALVPRARLAGAHGGAARVPHAAGPVRGPRRALLTRPDERHGRPRSHGYDRGAGERPAASAGGTR